MKSASVCPGALCNLGILSIFFFMLSACVTVKKHELPPDSEINKQAAWETHRVTLQSLQSWELKGRVVGNSQNQGFRAGVNWVQEAQSYTIDLHGPLGRKVAVITAMQDQVELKTSKGKTIEADNAEELMQAIFSYSLPLNGLRYWLLGVPDPEQVYADLMLDEQGKLIQLNQAGWLIDYKRYHESSPALPALIEITNPDVNANIKIDRWAIDQ